ncbi:MAG TPA: MarR family winged helix-turn-helix transcriptional regulator [Actinomycetes bacterium]|nr:MarR family winged helix-turn-helix transcriptional regulator [Actinomycetes bacterium]
MPRPTDTDYRNLLAFRTQLRRFNRWSEEQAAAAGLTHAQHQLLVAVRGHPDPRGPTIGEIAGYLLIRHHSAVQLVDRVQALGLVARLPDRDDQRVVRIGLTAAGDERVHALTALHLEELRRLAPLLDQLVARLGELAAARGRDGGLPAPERTR